MRITDGHKIKSNGNYELILNDTYLIHFYLKKRILVVIFLIGFLLFSFGLGFYTQNYSYQKNVYFFNTSEINFKRISLVNDYKDSSIVSKKIAPGTNGFFYLIIDNVKPNEQYRFIYSENTSKPERTIFCF